MASQYRRPNTTFLAHESISRTRTPNESIFHDVLLLQQQQEEGSKAKQAWGLGWAREVTMTIWGCWQQEMYDN